MKKRGLVADFLPIAPALQQWDPASWSIASDWQSLVSGFLQSPTGLELAAFVQGRLETGAAIYPPNPFHALDLTPRSGVRVVILGQDPYHGPGQAHGLAFSVEHGVPLPPSLRNIFKEIERDGGKDAALGLKAPRQSNGSLMRWAEQGVLMLNTCLTVEQGQPASHAKRGWEGLTDSIIEVCWANSDPTVFMLWGSHAQAKRTLMDAKNGLRHLVLTANHPSPLSALRPPKPFIGCGHFSLANAFLSQHGYKPITW